MYRRIEPGIYQHWNTFRAFACGEQEYFPTITKARKWRAERLERTKKKAHGRPERPRINRVKRSNAKAKDLPPGLSESVSRKYHKNGTVSEYPFIMATVCFYGTVVATVSRTFGTNRTRQKAIKEVVRERNRIEKEWFLI